MRQVAAGAACRAGCLPRRYWWSAEGFSTFIVIVAVGLLTFGVAFLADTVFGWERQVIGLFELVAVIGIVMSAAVLWVVMSNLLSAAPEAMWCRCRSNRVPGRRTMATRPRRQTPRPPVPTGVPPEGCLFFILFPP